MWDWISDVIDSVTTTIGETEWTEVLSSTIMPSLVGAGIGALATALTDGDITEGLLYGGVGGLVLGGLGEFGSQFATNWSLSSMEMEGGDYIDASSMFGEESVFTESDSAILSDIGIDTSPIEITSSTIANSGSAGGGSWWESTKDFASSEGGASLLLGAGSFIGNLLADDEDTQVDVANRQLDMEEESLANRATALSSFDVDEKDYVQGTNVRDVVSTAGVDYDKSEMGVNLG